MQTLLKNVQVALDEIFGVGAVLISLGNSQTNNIQPIIVNHDGATEEIQAHRLISPFGLVEVIEGVVARMKDRGKTATIMYA